MQLSLIPELPDVEEAKSQIEHSGDHRPVLFEYYKFSGILANFVASIQFASQAVKHKDEKEWAVLKGLLNRISKLILINIKMSSDGFSGEGTLIIDRCIFESACKAQWLMSAKRGDEFRRYFADGLKQEIEFSEYVKSVADQLNRDLTEFEQTLVRRVNTTVAASGMTCDEVMSTPKIENLKAIAKSVGASDLTYMINMQLGSHAVHGTWPALLSHYLQRNTDGNFLARDADCETADVQYFSVTIKTLGTIKTWCDWALNPSPEKKLMIQRCDYAEALATESYRESLVNRNGKSFRDRFEV